ncbi:MAG: choice-of-anchor Q domain-containing protein [Verrucomicrobiota bacterium]
MSGRRFLIGAALACLAWRALPLPAAAGTTYYVRVDNPIPSPPYTMWTIAATNIQQALAFAANGDLVLVSNGTYRITTELQLFSAVTVQSVNGAAHTIVDAGGTDRCFYVYHSNAVVDGFTLRNGNADYAALSFGFGGGVYCWPGSVVRNCIIQSNQAKFFGSPAFGGGAYLYHGGTLQNCLVVDNWAGQGGGVFFESGGTIQHCTVSSNTAAQGGGIYCNNAATSRNSIIYHNSGGADSNYFNTGPDWVYAYSCMAPLIIAPGNIASNPAFVNTASGNFHLAQGSPCIDTAWSVVGLPEDLDGVPRPLDGDADGSTNYDMGCFEFAGTNTDADADGLTDGAEVNVYGTNPKNPDCDGDTQRDGDETWAGTDPLAASSYFRVASAALSTNTGLLVRWPSISNRQYTVLRSTNLVWGTNFYALANNVTSSPPENTYTDVVGAAYRFYRVGVQR